MKEEKEKQNKILKIILKAGTGLYQDDYKTIGEYEVLDEQEFHNNLENIKNDLKEFIKDKKEEAIMVGALYKFPCEVNEVILHLNNTEITRIPIE